MPKPSSRHPLAVLLLLAGLASFRWAMAQPGVAHDSRCEQPASTACYFGFTPPGAGGQLHYYASLAPGSSSPVNALVAMHGHPRDADKTFDAALEAVRRGQALADTLVVAPLFHVAAGQAATCRTAGVPAAQGSDLLWTCETWLDGGGAVNGSHMTSFAALDALVAELSRAWPSLRTITIAGFSAGAQMVQHSIGFAAQPPAGVALRYVIADPGTWLYFDDVRPQPRRGDADVDWSACNSGTDFLHDCTLAFVPSASSCPAFDRWKYGLDDLPAALPRSAAEARARYARADIAYIEAALDSSAARGTFYPILDKSCAAMAQGPYRLQRGLAYARYEQAVLAPARPRPFVIVPGCAHDVACVFPSEMARPLLLGVRP